MKSPQSSYWKNRANERMAFYHKNNNKNINIINKVYDKAILELNSEIRKIHDKFAIDSKLSLKEVSQLLNSKISAKEIAEIKSKIDFIEDEELKKYLTSRMNAPAYKARMTRLEALKESIYIECKKAYEVELKESKRAYINTINEAYYRTMFDIQQGLGVGFDFSQMSIKTVNAILRNPWSGQQFSERVWNNTDVLAEKLTEVVTSGFMNGKSIDKMAKELEYMSSLGKYASERLVRTETTYIANAAEMESYIEADIDKYVFIATLDLRTSQVCREHDGKVYEVKKAVPGENMPPLHPYCRSTTIAYFGEDTLKNIQRRARDPQTGKTYLIPADMKYEQWYQEYAVNKYGEDRIQTLEKMIRNKSSDKKQYLNYKEILGEGIGVKSFAEYQELKYNNVNEWSTIKDYYKSRINGDISAFSTFGDYKLYKSKIENNLIGITTPNGIKIESYSKHFIDRVLGTNNDPKTNSPRDGVEVEDIKDALEKPLKIKEEPKKGSHKIIGEKVTVSINPDTGNLIQCNPTDGDLVRRLKGV